MAAATPTLADELKKLTEEYQKQEAKLKEEEQAQFWFRKTMHSETYDLGMHTPEEYQYSMQCAAKVDLELAEKRKKLEGLRLLILSTKLNSIPFDPSDEKTNIGLKNYI